MNLVFTYWGLQWVIVHIPIRSAILVLRLSSILQFLFRNMTRISDPPPPPLIQLNNEILVSLFSHEFPPRWVDPRHAANISI